MFSPLIQILIFAICFLVFGVLGMHYFFKQKRNSVLEALKNEDFKLIENIPISQMNMLGFSITKPIKHADIIFYEKNIVLIHKLAPFNGSHIIEQFTYTNETLNLDGATGIQYIESLHIENQKFSIKSNLDIIISKAQIETEIDFKDYPIDLKQIAEKYNYIIKI